MAFGQTGINTGTGAEVTTDLVGTAVTQVVKLDGGVSGSSAPILGSTANGLQVDVTRQAALPAGSNTIGGVTLANTLDNTNDSIDVPLHTTLLQWVPTITAGSAYAAGNNIGGATSFVAAVRSAGQGGVVDTVLITDKAKQNAAIDVFFFNVNSPLSTYTDHAAQALNAAELVNLAGHVSVLAANYANFSANSLATVANVGIRVKPSPGTTLLMLLVCRGTPTYASTSDLAVTVLLRQD